MKHCFLLGLLLLSNIGFSQSTPLPHIQQLQITDTVLINNINDVLKKKGKAGGNDNLLKKGFGYIRVNIQSFSQRENAIMEYHIDIGVNPIKDIHTSVYPDYYAYLDGKPVLIYLDALNRIGNNRYSKKSKKNHKQNPSQTPLHNRL